MKLPILCKIFGHKFKPYKYSPTSSYTVEKCVRCEELGEVISSEKDNKEAQRTTPWIP